MQNVQFKHPAENCNIHTILRFERHYLLSNPLGSILVYVERIEKVLAAQLTQHCVPLDV